MAAVKIPKVTSEDFSFGPWKILAKKGPILTSKEDEDIRSQLDIPALPEMCFGQTLLQISHESGFAISFNPVDSLKLVDNKNDTMKVAYASEWQQQRQQLDVSKEIAKPFDWTYSTDYQGTISGEDKLKIHDTEELIDLEKLKKHEKIHFYQSLVLFEDELADNGIAKLSVKMRVMPSSFFVLLRFFLRVDNVLVRVNDTRLYHEAGMNFLLREYSSKEKMVRELPIIMQKDENSVSEFLDLKIERNTKLEFEETDGT